MPLHHYDPEDIIALSLVHGAGRKAVHDALRIAARRDCALASLFATPAPLLLQVAAPGEEAAALALSRCGIEERRRAAWQIGLARDRGIRPCAIGDALYPGYLAGTLGNQAPPILFYEGNEALMQSRGAGIVGTRRPSLEGRDWARQCAALFAGEGVTVVSGGADGIDLEAHATAIASDGSTVVVLPQGLHGYDPPGPIRAGLKNGQVLLLSEFLPSDDWQTHRAMTRNRTIAAYSSLVCVIEPREKGGSMFTAEQALAQGKPVFYWGGACRDDALAGRPNAFPLLQSGELKRHHLRDAAHRAPAPAGRQADLFEQ